MSESSMQKKQQYQGTVLMNNIPALNFSSFSNRRLESDIQLVGQMNTLGNDTNTIQTKDYHSHNNTYSKPILKTLDYHPTPIINSYPPLSSSYLSSSLNTRNILNNNEEFHSLNIKTNSNSNANTNSCSVSRKQAYLSKMARMDDENFKKIIQIVDNLDYTNPPNINISNSNSKPNQKSNTNFKSITTKKKINEPTKLIMNNYTQNNSIESLLSSSPTHKSTSSTANKVSINYINTETVNFGNININYNSNTNTRNNYSLEDNDQPTLRKNSNYHWVSFRILSNWGHKDHIGLSGIEVYDINGNRVDVKEVHLTQANDRNITLLFNGRNNTIFDDEMWQCDYSSNQQANMKLDLFFDLKKNEIGWIVIWNYNGKELNKGVRDMEILSKYDVSWKGVITKGVYNTKEDFSTKIPMWTRRCEGDEREGDYNENEEMNYNTNSNSNYNSNNNTNSNYNSNSNTNSNNKNPDGQYIINSINSARNQAMNHTKLFDQDLNVYDRNVLHTSIVKNSIPSKDNETIPTSTQVNPSNYTGSVIWCNKIKMVFSSNYGHRKYTGLTGLQFLDENKAPINIEQASSIGALPKDINTYYNDNDDNRIFENVFNGINTVNDENQMWLTVIKANEPLPYLELMFDNMIGISCIRVWNYNCPDELDKGVKTIDLYFDDHQAICPFQETIILHKGIGDAEIDYSQDITFPIKHCDYNEEELKNFQITKFASFLYDQCYETPFLPSGFILKLTLLSTWGDDDYIGLNAIEIYDQEGNEIFDKKTKWVNKYRLIAYPSNINETLGEEETLENRRIGNLFKGNHYDATGKNAWLSPLNLPQRMGNENIRENTIYLIFERPVIVSKIRMFNYIKKPSRGVKDMKMFLDDKLIFAGQLRQANSTIGTNHDDKFLNETIILFTCDSNIIKNLNEEKLSKPINDKSDTNPHFNDTPSHSYKIEKMDTYTKLTCLKNNPTEVDHCQ